MHRLTIMAALAVAAAPALAQDAPTFFAETMPSQSVGPILQVYGALQGKEAALSRKTSELIMLAVAAQIPCQHCVYAHAKNARSAGATDAELREAVAAAGMVRLFSTTLHGAAYDFDAFKSEHDAIAPPVN